MTYMASATAAAAIVPAMMGGSTSSSGSTSTDPFKTSSGLGTTKFDGANSTTVLSEPFQTAQTGFLDQSQQSLGQLGAFSNTPFQASQPFDLQGITQNQYNMLEGLQANGRQDQALNMEERLFNQGRLGSTGGIAEQRNLQDFFGQQQAQNMQSAFGQGLQGQAQQFMQDIGSSERQTAQQQLLASLSSGLFGSSMAPEQALLQQFQTGGAFAPQQTETESEDNGWF